MSKRLILAYSGGLDTSVAIRWLAQTYGFEVITFTVDVGQERELADIESRALKAGAVKAIVKDGKDGFTREFVLPALQADAVYEGAYPLATALSRPMISQQLVEVARSEQAVAVAHGCTGKGNDQVRFEVSVAALAPDLKVFAPAREWGMTREQEVEYAHQHGIPVTVKTTPYSIDENLWGRAIECGVLEDPWAEPPEEVFAWTRPVDAAPDKPAYVEIEFQQGVPVALDGETLDIVSLIRHVNALAGQHGVGRIDHLENRLVGIKSREIYESPGATVLLKAHEALEAMTLSRDQLRFKAKVAQEYAELIYNGLWYSAMRRDLQAYVDSTQRYVSGSVRVRLHKGTCAVVGRKSPYSLYSYELATYGTQDLFNQSDAPGFIHLWGLPVRLQAQVQGKEQGQAGGRHTAGAAKGGLKKRPATRRKTRGLP